MSMMSIMLNYYYGTSNHAPCVSNCTCAEGLHFIIVIGKMSIYAVYCVCNNTYTTVTITLFLYNYALYK